MDRRPLPPRDEAEQLAHELNNLLAIIGGHADALEPALPAAGPDHESLEAIQRAVRTAAALAGRVRRLGGPPPLQTRGTDVGPIVDAAAGEAARRFGQRLVVAAAPTPSLWSASLPAAAIAEAIGHLVDRTAEHMPHGGLLTIRRMNVELGPAAGRPSSRRERYVRIEMSGAIVHHGCGESVLAQRAAGGADRALEAVTRGGGRVSLETDGATMVTWALLLPSDGIEPLRPATPQRGTTARRLDIDEDRGLRVPFPADRLLAAAADEPADGRRSGETA